MNKIKLYIDPLTKKVTGYEIVSNHTIIGKNDVLIPLDEFNAECIGKYYVDEEIVDTFQDEYNSVVNALKERINELYLKSQNEQQWFIDLIADGADQKDAACLIKKNRENLDKLEKELKTLVTEHEQKIEDYYADLSK